MIRLKVRVLEALQGLVSGHGLVSRDPNFELSSRLLNTYQGTENGWKVRWGVLSSQINPGWARQSHSALLLSSLCYLHEMCSDFLAHFHLNKKELCKIHLCIYCRDALQTVFSGKHAEKESGLQRFSGGGINHRKEHNAGNGTGADRLHVDLTKSLSAQEELWSKQRWRARRRSPTGGRNGPAPETLICCLCWEATWRRVWPQVESPYRLRGANSWSHQLITLLSARQPVLSWSLKQDVGRTSLSPPQRLENSLCDTLFMKPWEK